MSCFEKRPERWLPKGPVPENDAEPEVRFSELSVELPKMDKQHRNLTLEEAEEQVAIVTGMSGKMTKEMLDSIAFGKNIFKSLSEEGKVASDGSSASYYELPPGSSQLQDLISHRNMNAQIGEIFRAAYRYGQSSHSDKLRDAKKIRFYAEAEIARLEKYGD
jgi:hypothetical protein